MVKKLFLLQQEILKKEQPLFLKYDALNVLLKSLADTFRSHYAKPPAGKVSIIEFLLEGVSARTQQLLCQMETYHLWETRELLKDHNAVLKMYTECIDKSWPHNALAVPQLIISISMFGNSITSHYFSRSTHTLECPNIKWAKRCKVELPGTHHSESSGCAALSMELTSELVEQEGSNAAVELVHRSPSPLTPLPSSDGLN
ncbi:hypothetical protein EDD16DRAFT_1704151 [Pisolithus croceorrhizus]|nr:hypothetical protein EDD16DRAFT_1704151 [Pisolithus croceorrhizus]